MRYNGRTKYYGLGHRQRYWLHKMHDGTVYKSTCLFADRLILQSLERKGLAMVCEDTAQWVLTIDGLAEARRLGE